MGYNYKLNKNYNLVRQDTSAALYADTYMAFSWNGHHSSDYNCFIENKGSLNFVPQPDFSNDFVTPSLGGHSIYNGLSIKTKTLTLSLVFYQLTLPQINEAMNWLNISTISDLIFDYNPLWKLNVKLSSMDKIEQYVNGHTKYKDKIVNLYICKFSVTFETVSDANALSRYKLCAISDELFGVSKAQNCSADIPIYNADSNNLSSIIRQLPTKQATLGSEYISTDYEKDEDYPVVVSAQYKEDNYIYITLIVNNNSSSPASFYIDLYNVHYSFNIWNYGENINNTPELIAHAILNLYKNDNLNITYASDSGTLTCCSNLLQQLRGLSGKFLTTYAESMSQIFIPANSKTILKIEINNTTLDITPSCALYFNNCAYI